MNPLLIFKLLRDLSALIEEANRLAGPGKRWTLAITNRSFIAACIAFVAGVALMVGVPFPLPVDLATDTAYALIVIGGMVWAAAERWLGKSRAIWNRKQAAEAVQEADALKAALGKAGAPVG